MNLPSIKKAAVIGAGSWGTVMGRVLAHNLTLVTFWARDQDVVRSINEHRTNEKFLPDFKLPENVSATGSYEEALRGAQLVLWAIPVQYSRERLAACAHLIEPQSVVVNLSKGIETETWHRPSQIIMRACPHIRAHGTLGGPNIASEVARGLPASATLAITNHWEADDIRRAFCTPAFRVDTSADLAAVELAGALKNVVAIGAGICDGLKLGENAKARVIAEGFEEMRTIGRALGANPEAFSSSFGLGDLLATCYSSSSRNRSLGEFLGRGLSPAASLQALNGRVAEGASTTKACCELAAKLGISLPLAASLNEILHASRPLAAFVDRI